MGKVLWTEDGDQFHQTDYPGCISGIFHALHHQYWHSNVKKIIPHRSHKSLDKHTKRNRGYKRVSDDEDPFEILKLLDPETSHILVDKSNRKTSSTQKRSLKSRIKALVSDDNNEEHNPDAVPSPRLQRTYSVHHSESNEWVHPINFFPESVNSESSVSSKRHSNVTIPEIKDSQDILEMFEVDKEIFMNFLQDGSQVSDTKPKFTKSGSFPTAYRNFRPTTLKDKMNEFYTISRSEKKLDALGPKLTSSNSNNDLNNNSMRIKRASSLNESADRYARLFDINVTKDAALRPSRSLKLTIGSEKSSNAQELSFLNRNHSLPHLDNPNQESCDIRFLRSASQYERNPVSTPLNKDTCAGSNSTQDCESLNDVIDKSDNLLENEEEIRTEFQISEGMDLVQNSQENLEKIKMVTTNKQMKSNLNSSRRQYQDDDDFTYVKRILERSGFIKNGFQQTWYSSNQPLDPFVFQEIESEYVHDPDRFVEELKELSHRLLIFELVDDVLLTIHERSLRYYPKALSSWCHVRHPSPTGTRVLDEVWKTVRRLLDLKPDMNQSLDCIVSRDMGSDDGWMNLQLDSECVGLDLEDLILDEILEELLCECC